MEGVTDAPMRALMTEHGGFSFCVTDFFRISQDVPYPRAIAEHVPELAFGSRTPCGVPIQVQFLGGDPEKLAESALRACSVGATAIDLNFGCPAPLVNRHDGGASLLKHPQRIRAIVSAVRKALPPTVPVSAKLRLGWDCVDDIHANADSAAEGGASWLTIHGRTKTQGYRPPAHWAPIGEVQRRLGLPIVANGDIWTMDDFARCRDETGCEHFMIGRSALANPNLPLLLSRALGLSTRQILPVDWLSLFRRYAEICKPFAENPNYTLCRIKQWLSLANVLRTNSWVEQLKRSKTLEELFALMS